MYAETSILRILKISETSTKLYVYEFGFWHELPSCASTFSQANPKKNMVYGTLCQLTITTPYVDFRVDYNTFTMDIGQPYATESTLSLHQSRLYPSVRDLGFDLCYALLLYAVFCTFSC